MEAILLAAGEGSRLRPFTVDKPKPMVRVANKPIAQHAVEALVANGVTDITFVLGYQREKVQAHFGDGRRFGARVRYAFQEVLTGTAGALATVSRPAGPFLVLGADNVVDASLIKEALDAPNDAPIMVLHRSQDARRYGVVAVEKGLVRAIDEKPEHPRSAWVNTGVYRFPREFHERVRESVAKGLAGLPDVLAAALAQGADIKAVSSRSFWCDAVYPWDLLRVHAQLLRRGHSRPPVAAHVVTEEGVLVGKDVQLGPGTVLSAGTAVGDNVEIGANCVLENCVVYDDVQIGSGAILRNTVIGEGTRLGPRVTSLSGPCDIRTVDGWHSLADFGSVVGADCVVGGAVTLLPGTLVGNHVHVAPTRVVSGTIEDGSKVV